MQTFGTTSAVPDFFNTTAHEECGILHRCLQRLKWLRLWLTAQLARQWDLNAYALSGLFPFAQRQRV
jgi:hypothetical protein